VSHVARTRGGPAGRDAGRRRTRLAPDERRAQILVVAQRLFSEQPVGTVSMEAIAREAGTTAGLIYHYFGDKHGLYVAVVREMFRGGPPVPEPAAGATTEERLDESTSRWLDMVEANRETWLAALGAEGLGRDPEVELIFDHVREAAVDNLIGVLGIGPARDAASVARAVLRTFGGLAEAATREWLQSGRLSRAQTHALLTSSLLALVNDVLPLVEQAEE
jgi:AcrR family transcriptional regulator